jgi:type IV fimbrial biogenesis protein FimT
MHRRTRLTHLSGFTLLELITVMSIAAILMAIGVPSYRSVTTSSRMSTEINSLWADMQFARSEAMKQGLPVTVCVSTNGSDCTGSAHWHGGWIAFSDSNRNAGVDSGKIVLRVGKPLTGGDTLEGPANFEAVRFNREGFALGLPNAGVLLTLHDAANKRTFTRCLAITMAGMITTQTPASAPATCL